MAMKQANAAQKKWMSDIVDWSINNIGMLYTSKYDGAIPQLHHVLGRSAKQNKIAIGHWFILPVPFELHDVSSDHPLNVTHNKKAFTAMYGMQRVLFDSMYYSMMNQGYTVPINEINLAIQETNA